MKALLRPCSVWVFCWSPQYICSPFSWSLVPDAASPTIPIFNHMVNRESFLLVLDSTFKKPFPRLVCLCNTSVENSDSFFPTRSASSGVSNSNLQHHLQTRTHPHTQTHKLTTAHPTKTANNSFLNKDEDARCNKTKRHTGCLRKQNGLMA